MKRLAAAFTLIATSAVAGEQYVDRTGYAASGYDVVAYFDMEQAPVGEPQPLAVPGSKDFTAEHNGATFAFSSQENLARFQADPARYAPQYDGHCAYGVAVDSKVPANPHLWRVVDGKLYLNITEGVVEDWEADIPGFITKADETWGELEDDRAARGRVPSFDASAAPRQ